MQTARKAPESTDPEGRRLYVPTISSSPVTSLTAQHSWEMAWCQQRKKRKVRM